MKVKFLPSQVELDIAPDQSIMQLAHENNIFIKSICNGMPSCAECRVIVEEGEFNVPPPSAKELSLIGTGHFIDRRRLSCQMVCFGDVTVNLDEQIEKENAGPRRPQGANQKAAEENSQAVSGSLIHQEAELVQQVSVETQPRDKKKYDNQNRNKSNRSGKSNNAKSSNNRNRNRRRR